MCLDPHWTHSREVWAVNTPFLTSFSRCFFLFFSFEHGRTERVFIHLRGGQVDPRLFCWWFTSERGMQAGMALKKYMGKRSFFGSFSVCF